MMNQSIESNSIEEIIEIIQCPICYLAMTPPLRTPMITPECGHTICQQCISKVKECPICNHIFSTPLKNILVCQIADVLQKKKLIPEDINPLPTQENKLIPKIEGICTITATGDKKIWQKYYQCKTCNTSGFCELCSKACHNGHDVLLIKDGTGCCCSCGTNEKQCLCLPKTQNLRCTAEMTYETAVDQPMYQCFDCDITGDNFICQHCAMKCHFQHRLRYVGIVKNKICNCFDNNTCQIAQRKPVCTFLFSGEKYIKQQWYHCKTCGLVNECGCCAVCAKNCHKGHEIIYEGIHDQCYCDCGGGTCPNCKMCSSHDHNYMNFCTNIDKDHKNEEKEQRAYHCQTCGITGNFAICEACAINCHVNHSIEYAGVTKFVCICRENCKIKFLPLLRNDRSICDRKVLNDDDISPCYTCYTCDPNGKKQICETCAFKQHENHDIHLIGYLAFKCSSDEPK